MRQPRVCDYCGGRFGLVTHRWWNNKFCKRTCKGAYLRELVLGRYQISRWSCFPRAGWFKTFLIPHRPTIWHETSLRDDLNRR